MAILVAVTTYATACVNVNSLTHGLRHCHVLKLGSRARRGLASDFRASEPQVAQVGPEAESKREPLLKL